MTRAIDPNFDETTLTCSFERQLWKEQKAYLWTILLTVWKNPLGKACISDFIKNKEAQKAYIKHNGLQEMAPGKIYDTGEALSGLINLSLKDYNGSRVEFIGEWFEQLRLLNEYDPHGMDWGMISPRACY